MKFKSFLRKFFLGREVLEKVYSPVNGEILVAEDLFGRREMVIGRVVQSGGLVKKLWSQLFQVQSAKFKVQNCLILGLGCGTTAKMLAKRYPQAKLVGVEIDPEVVGIGKKYFGLGKIPNLKIIVDDAIKFIDDSRLTIYGSQFSLVIVDLYLGQEFPREAESESFFQDLQKIMASDGLIIFNRLYYREDHQRKADRFVLKVKKFFQVKTKKAATNLLIFASLEANFGV